MIPSQTEIEYFLEVYKTGHISRSATRLGVTQPTLTQSILKLEDKLKVKLFFRTKSGVIPTKDGDFFYGKTRSLLDCWAEIQHGVKSTQQEVQGHFKIGCHPSVAAYTIPTLLDRLNQHAPKIEIELVHDFSRKILDSIVSYQIDLGFVVNPVKHPDLVLKKLGNDRVMFWKKAGLNKVPQKIIADANLNQINEMLGKSSASALKTWNLVQSNNLELIRTLTLQGLGVGVLPERVALADGAKLVCYDPKLPTYSDEIYLAYRKEALASKAGQELVKYATMALE